MIKIQSDSDRPAKIVDETPPDIGLQGHADWLPSIDELFTDPKVRRRVGDVIANAVLRGSPPKP
jgi:hypothetical protein